MLKVILTAHDGREIKLLPEHISLREALDKFHADCEGKAYIANGAFLQEDDLDRELVKVAKNDEVRIESVLKPAEREEHRSGFSTVVLSSSEAVVYNELVKAREYLDRAIGFLGNPADVDDPPF